MSGKSRREKRKSVDTPKQSTTKRQRGDNDGQLNLSKEDMAEFMRFRQSQRDLENQQAQGDLCNDEKNESRKVQSVRNRKQSSAATKSIRKSKTANATKVKKSASSGKTVRRRTSARRTQVTPPDSDLDEDCDQYSVSNKSGGDDSESDDQDTVEANSKYMANLAPNLGLSDDDDAPSSEKDGRSRPDQNKDEDVRVYNKNCIDDDARDNEVYQENDQLEDAPRTLGPEKSQNSCDVRSKTNPMSNGQQSSVRLGPHDFSSPVVEQNKTVPGSSLPSDVSMVLTLLKEFEERVTKHVTSENARLAGDISRLYKENKALRDELTDMYAVVCHTAQCVASKGQAVSLKNMNLSKKLSLLAVIFSTSIFTHVLAKCSVGYCAKTISTMQSNSIAELGINMVLVLFFSRQPSERKCIAFSSSVGKDHSFYRKGIMLTALHAMQNNVFDTFLKPSIQDLRSSRNETKGEPNVGEDATIKYVSNGKLRQPTWLKPGYISYKHCDIASQKAEGTSSTTENDIETNNDLHDVNGSSSQRGINSTTSSALDNCSALTDKSDPISSRHVDSTKQTKKGKFNSGLSRDVLAVEASTALYSIITSVLHKSRDSSKAQLFIDLLYPFVGWTQYKVPVSQDTLKLYWVDEASSNTVDIKSIPETNFVDVVRRFSLEDDDIEETTLKNKRLMKKEIETHKGLVLCIEHDVVVDSKLCRLKHGVSMIEVAAKMLASYTSIETNSTSTHFLNIDKDCLRIVYTVGHALRSIIDVVLKEVQRTKTIMWSNSKSGKKRSKKNTIGQVTQSLEYKFPSINGLSIDQLFTTPTKQKELLGPMLLSLKPEEFQMKSNIVNETLGYPNVDDDSRDRNEADGGAIQIDRSLGVFQL